MYAIATASTVPVCAGWDTDTRPAPVTGQAVESDCTVRDGVVVVWPAVVIGVAFPGPW